MLIHVPEHQVNQSPPKPLWQRWRLLRFAIPIAIILLGGGYGWSKLTSAQQSAKILTQPVERKSIPVTITANGTVNAERSINLSPKSAGVIKQLLVKEGDRVTQGQVIAVMDDSNLRGQLVQMQGQLAQQEANLKRLQAGNRREDIVKAEAQVAEAKANLQQLLSGNRPQPKPRHHPIKFSPIAPKKLLRLNINLNLLKRGRSWLKSELNPIDF
jgi:HlyD family secretion protein